MAFVMMGREIVEAMITKNVWTAPVGSNDTAIEMATMIPRFAQTTNGMTGWNVTEKGTKRRGSGLSWKTQPKVRPEEWSAVAIVLGYDREMPKLSFFQSPRGPSLSERDACHVSFAIPNTLQSVVSIT